VFDAALRVPAVLTDRLTLAAAEESLSIPGQPRHELWTQAGEQGWGQAQVRVAARQHPCQGMPH
jgi:hypothetical protein